MKPFNKEPKHVLYSRGQLIESEDVDQENALAQLAIVTSRTTDQVRERLLCGERKKIKSSASLKQLIRLQQKLENCGLDAYIKLDDKK
ncbi:hypothetical protein [Arenicella sp. 4NH20-0111]|uniref:hypothetical protein n=1 Tax=Arenicella sp. 4NH20-0111 TaxID=3127648 RepID=UPI0033425FF0